MRRAWARAVIISASVLGQLGARLADALAGRAKQQRRPDPQVQGSGSNGVGSGASVRASAGSSPLFSAPWVKQLQDTSIRPRDILRRMYAQTALATAVLVLAAASAAKCAAMLLRAVAVLVSTMH